MQPFGSIASNRENKQADKLESKMDVASRLGGPAPESSIAKRKEENGGDGGEKILTLRERLGMNNNAAKASPLISSYITDKNKADKSNGDQMSSFRQEVAKMQETLMKVDIEENVASKMDNVNDPPRLTMNDDGPQLQPPSQGGSSAKENNYNRPLQTEKTTKLLT